jgi:uncharacterized protein
LRIRNITRDRLLGDQVEIADSSAKRRTGLLKHTSLEPGHGLWIVPCEAIHMIGMKFPIDVVFLSKKRQVLKLRERIPPGWKFSFCFTAHSVIELPAGTIADSGTQKGDQLELIR